ncbi:MAG TPA: M20/M25/M40 family metallo-hydrolase [Candidatus Eremiobacteraceae bacterium]|jgi:tripeptide aminopeptidase|nr:M20/M25/M40 family metallo-hydrolase [Candidatus Eremiobacteraceae bacterium]
MIRKDRMVETVMDLVRLDSHSKQEKPVADYLVRALGELGASVQVDDAGTAVQGNTGNVVARFAARGSGAAPLLLSSHMDVVPPGTSVKPLREADRVRSDGTTILGGDDKSGLAVILEVVRALKEHDVQHGPIEVAFTICEEVGLLGAKHLDYGAIQSKEAIVLDSARSSQLVTAAPSADRFTITVHGLEAHAGMCPEDGISAVRVAAEAIASMPVGRVDRETTTNVIITGGPTAVNVVPNFCVVRGEARSLRDERLDEVMRSIRASFADAASRATITLGGDIRRAWIEEQCEREYHSMQIPADAPIVQLVMRAARRLDVTVETITIGGGSDANVYNRHGITSVNLGTGMRDIHTVNEWIDLEDFYRSAEIVLQCVKERAAAQGS